LSVFTKEDLLLLILVFSTFYAIIIDMIVTIIFKASFRGQKVGTIFATGGELHYGFLIFYNKELRRLQLKKQNLLILNV